MTGGNGDVTLGQYVRRGELIEINLFYVDNELGDYLIYNRPAKHEKRVAALLKRTGHKNTIRTLRVARWVTEEVFLEEMQKRKLSRRARFEEYL